MLDPGNRQALTEQLRPPTGFRLSHAVGTTFTLDMISALSVPLSFVAGSGEEFTNPVAVLSALRKVSDRIDIFCQAGHIKAPKDASDLLALLEPMVHQVSAPRGGLFHPKVWFLEFENDEERQYRFLCSSRNLTPDASWDLLVRLDGAPAENPAATGPSSATLSRFLLRLPALCTVDYDGDRLARLRGLASRLGSVRWDLPDGIDQLAFRPLGTGEQPETGSVVAHIGSPDAYPGLNGKTGKEAFLGGEKLIISPFLDDTIIGRFHDRWTEKVYVYSRADQLDLLGTETVEDERTEFSAFDELGIPESSATGVADPGASGQQATAEDLSGLHAKAYFCDYSHWTYALLGSSNATLAGFTRNIEFLVELRGKKSRLGVQTIRENLKSVPFEDYLGDGGAARPDENEAAFRLESALRDAAGRLFLLDALPDECLGGKPTYTVTVTHDWSPDPRFQAQLRLLSVPQASTAVVPAAGRQEHAFPGIPLADVTPYLILTLEDPESGISKSTVVQGSLRTDPQGRLEEIIARQLDDPDKLRQFLLLFLTPETAPPGSGTGAAWSFASGFGGSGTAGLFEALVGAVANADAPAVFADLKIVIDRLLELRGEEEEIHYLHSLWMAAVEATGADLGSAPEGASRGI
ncbi:phospholipase D family protein [Arthrobacter mangrovi]|uniref:PLD phosphodiesterase domain-containing protein n=1 Tax=Arthrobacter mangrovi TaxID=2966350 RepID=A0ABQ5MYD7_9MICC|nr:phospholipase D family protein [Arthrobacter mangrovi]GLB68966.1 hypothetical protein AHIS1636_34090 [Arthrobacter mangrovi]